MKTLCAEKLKVGGLMVAAALALVLVAAASARAQDDSFEGVWTMESAQPGDTLSVELTRRPPGGGRDSRFFKVELEKLEGLARASVFSRGDRVTFRLRRPAGTFDFAGEFREGKGAGTFTFTADPQFVERMRREGYGEAVRENLFGFAVGNYGGAVADELSALGVERPTPDQLKSMQLFGVTPDYVRSLRALGYEPHSVEQLISLRLQGATVEYIKAISAETAVRPTLEQLVSMRLQGVTLKFVEELKSLGYERLTPDQLVSMRMFGVTTDLIRRLRAEGSGFVPVERLVDMRLFNVPADLVRRMPARNASDSSAGDWYVKFYRRGTDRVWVSLRDRAGRIENRSFEVAPARLEGLSESEVFSGGETQVRFTLVRDGATLLCTGWFKDGFGVGTYVYAPGGAAQH
jgi:hypothetical protein